MFNGDFGVVFGLVFVDFVNLVSLVSLCIYCSLIFSN